MLKLPWDDDTLISLLNTAEFKSIVSADMSKRLDYIRKIGNSAAHDGKKISKEQAMLCLQNLWLFMDFISYCYGDSYTEGQSFNPSLPDQHAAPEFLIPPETEAQLQQLMQENPLSYSKGQSKASIYRRRPPFGDAEHREPIHHL